MLDHAVLLLGIVMVLAGIGLAYVKRSTPVVITMLVLGVVSVLIGVPGLQNLVFKFGGQEATITMQDLKVGANDIQAQLASNNQKIQTLTDSLSKQVGLNQDINARFARIEAKIGLSETTPLPTNVVLVSPSLAARNSYVVLVFYKDERAKDATDLKLKLIAAGYQASAINSSLAETSVGPQPDNSAYVVYTTRGASIVDGLETIIKSSSATAAKNPIDKSGPDALRRGDAQIYLF